MIVTRIDEEDSLMKGSERKGSLGSLVGQKSLMKDLIEYQESAIVSKTLIDKRVGTITLFAFDRDQGLSEHTAPFDAMVQVLDGEAEVTVEGTKNHLVEGEAIIMPANSPHALKAINRFKMLLTMIKA